MPKSAILQLVDRLVANQTSQEDTLLSWDDILAEGWRDQIRFLDALLQLSSGEAEYLCENDDRIDAYESLWRLALTELQVYLRSGDEPAQTQWQVIQQALIARMHDGAWPPILLQVLLHVFSNQGMALSEAFLDESKEWLQKHLNDVYGDSDVELDDVLDEILQSVDQYQIRSPYEFFGLWADQVTYMPRDAIDAWFDNLLMFDNPVIRESLVLFLLHRRSEVRDAALDCLAAHTDAVSSLGLRRLIQLRNWLSGDQAQALDALIRQLRRRGLVCAGDEVSPGGRLLQLVASPYDGAGAMSLLAVFEQGEQHYLAGCVLREALGVVDSWVSQETSRTHCEEMIHRMRDETGALPVTTEFAQHLLPHFLSMNRASAEPLTPEFLQIMEWFGIGSWNPQPVVASTWLATFRELLPQDDEAMQQSLLRSAKWPQRYRFVESWFEQDREIAERAQECLVHAPQFELAMVDDLLAPYRDKWFERFVHMALWRRCSEHRRGPRWDDFAYLAMALEPQTPLSQSLSHVPLMVHVALLTLDFYAHDAATVADADDVAPFATEQDWAALASFLDRLPQAMNFHAMLGVMTSCALAPDVPEWPVVRAEILHRHRIKDTESAAYLDLMAQAFVDVKRAIDARSATLPCQQDHRHHGFEYVPLMGWSEGFTAGVNLCGGWDAWRARWPARDHALFDVSSGALQRLAIGKRYPKLSTIDLNAFLLRASQLKHDGFRAPLRAIK